MIELALAGATGRMGRCVLDLVGRGDRFRMAAALTRPDDPMSGTTLHVGDEDVPVVEKLGTSCEVLIDFSVADGTIAWLDVCERFEIPMVIGATGHSAEQLARIREGARLIPIVLAYNFSAGIHALLGAIGRIARQLSPTFDIEIVETHHRHKVDAPSGTALNLADAMLEATGKSRDKDLVCSMDGDACERSKGKIAVRSVRTGEVIGQHEIHFTGQGETLTISHTVQSRETFAAGALRAAEWVIDREPGFYTMSDLLG